MAHPTGEDHCCAPGPHTPPSLLAVWPKHLVILSGMSPISKQALSTLHNMLEWVRSRPFAGPSGIYHSQIQTGLLEGTSATEVRKAITKAMVQGSGGGCHHSCRPLLLCLGNIYAPGGQTLQSCCNREGIAYPNCSLSKCL